MFWGLVLKANKRYSQVVTKAFHVSHATLDVHSADADDNVIQVWLNTDDTNHLLCNVSKQSSHVPLDLAFTEGETIAFYSKGSGTVHLTGFLMPDEPDYDDLTGLGIGEEEDESEEEEVNELPTQKKEKKQKPKKTGKAVGNDVVNSEEDEDDQEDEEEDDDDDDDDDIDLDATNLVAELEEEDDDDDDDDDEEDEYDDASSNSDEENIQRPAKVAKLDKAAKQNGLANGKAPNQEKQKKKKEKDGSQKLKNQQLPQQQKQQKQQAAPQQAAQQQAAQQQQQKSAPKTLAHGVIIEDLRVGKGPEAKSGKRVQVYYEGRLKSNNKVFDSTKAGEGFKFCLGRGEVIRGWDIGVAGMKVGSKRRITCPANAAYGAKGSPPVIPGNATLVFDVELRGVN